MSKVKRYVSNQPLRMLYQLNKFVSTMWNYCLGKSSFMPSAARWHESVGCFKTRDEMFEHI